MTLQGGHRFTVSMNMAFSHGLYAMGVEQAVDHDATTGRQSPIKVRQTGHLLSRSRAAGSAVTPLPTSGGPRPTGRTRRSAS